MLEIQPRPWILSGKRSTAEPDPKPRPSFLLSITQRGFEPLGKNANTFDTNRLTGGSLTPRFANGVCSEKAEPAPTCMNLIHLTNTCEPV